MSDTEKHTQATERIIAEFIDDGGQSEYRDPINGHQHSGQARKRFETWLADHERLIAERTLLEAHHELVTMLAELTQGGRHTRASWALQWLVTIIARKTNPARHEGATH